MIEFTDPPKPSIEKLIDVMEQEIQRKNGDNKVYAQCTLKVLQAAKEIIDLSVDSKKNEGIQLCQNIVNKAIKN